MKKRFFKIIQLVAVVTMGGIMSLTTGCGSGGGNSPASTSQAGNTATGTLDLSAGGKTKQPSIPAPGGSSVTVDPGTTFTNISTTAAPAGSVKTTVTSLTDSALLPAGASASLPTDHDLKSFLIVDLGSIKKSKPAVTVKMTISNAAPGSLVDVFNFNTSNSSWSMIQEDVTVGPDGTITVKVDHFSILAAGPKLNPKQRKLIISGIPDTIAICGKPYSFTPTVFAPDFHFEKGFLTFTITNEPSWATFSTTTGTLSGTPTAADVGVTTGIVICVIDKNTKACLPPFNIRVICTGANGLDP